MPRIKHTLDEKHNDPSLQFTLRFSAVISQRDPLVCV
jgi:hypothetical protein